MKRTQAETQIGVGTASAYRFDDVSLDVAALELLRSGERVEVQLKALDLLVFLLRNRERVVERVELFDALWPDEIVSEASLTQAVKGARRALGDDGAAQRRIRTVRGRGYRFIGPVEEVTPRSAATPGTVSSDAALRIATSSRGESSEPAAAQSDSFERGPLAILAEKLAAAGRSEGGLVTISGEPGIGKTTWIARIAEHAREAGALVARGRAVPDAADHWPWVQLLRDALRQREPADLRADLAGQAPDLITSFPELRELPALHGLPAPDEPGSMSVAQSGEEVGEPGDAVANVLQRIASKRLTVLILEDLHHADGASLQRLRLVASAAADCPMLVVASYCDPAPGGAGELRAALASLRTGRAFAAVELEGLGRDALAELFTRETGAPPSAALLDRVAECSDRNPYVARELLAHWRREGLLDASPDSPQAAFSFERAGLPEAVRSVVAPRLAGFSAGDLEILGAAALLSRPGASFDRTLLARLVGDEGVQSLAVLERAAKAQVVRSVPSSPDRCEFTRSLARELLYQDIDPRLRRDLHARAARELELDHLADLEGWLPEIAAHYFEALPTGDVEKCIGYLLASADTLGEERAIPWLYRAVLASKLADGSNAARREAIEERLEAARAR